MMLLRIETVNVETTSVGPRQSSAAGRGIVGELGARETLGFRPAAAERLEDGRRLTLDTALCQSNLVIWRSAI
jgi:hypothetical protein